MSELFNPDFLIQSPSYAETMNSTVLPFLEQRQRVHTVPGCESRPLFCVTYAAENPLAAVLIVHGFTENAYKYAELIYSLLRLRFSVVAYDQRGHGRSWRADGIPDPSVTHVDHFDDYVEDLRIVADAFRPADHPFFVFAHSMGGAVTSLFLERHPGVFDAAVLSSPMIAPYLSGIPASVASALGAAAGGLGKGKKNPFFMKPYAGPEDFATSCATDPNRFAWYDAVKASRPEFRNSTPSWQWIREAVSVTKKILAPGEPEKIACPVLLFTAEKDFSVLPEPQRKFISRVPSGRSVFVPGSRHEIFRSENAVLFPWWHQVISFYRERLAPSVSAGGQ